MAEESSEIKYVVTILRVKNDAVKAVVTRTLAGVTKNAPLEQIQAKMEKLPWTISRRASEQKARRLVQLLGKLGAVVEVQPPLPGIAVPQDISQTQILRTDDLSPQSKPGGQTQITPGVEAQESAPQPIELIPQTLRSPIQLDPVRPATREPGSEDVDLDLEPLTLGGILDRSFQICRRSFWKLLAIVAIPWLLTAFIALAAALVAIFLGVTKQYLDGVPLWVWILLGVTVLPAVVIVWILAFYISQGALIHAVSSIYLGRKVLIGQAYRFVTGRLGKFVLTSLLMIPVMLGLTAVLGLAGGLLAAVGYGFFVLFRELTSSGWWSAVTWPLLSWIFLGCLLVYTYVLTKLLLVDKVVIIENIGYTSAFRRSWRLLTVASKESPPLDYVLRFILLLQIFILINFAIYFLFQVPAAVFAIFVPDSKIVATVVREVVSNMGSILAGLYGSVAMVLFYYDLRNRKEGFDLKMLAAATDRRSALD